MKNKKVFNNLYDSILLTLSLLAMVAILFCGIYFGVVNRLENTRDIVVALILLSPLVLLTISCTVIFVNNCYGYWILSEHSICSKKLLRGKVTIKLNEIDKVEKKTIPALIFGIFESDAYIIHSKGQKIEILLKEKRDYFDLDNKLANFFDIESHSTT